MINNKITYLKKYIELCLQYSQFDKEYGVLFDKTFEIQYEKGTEEYDHAEDLVFDSMFKELRDMSEKQLLMILKNIIKNKNDISFEAYILIGDLLSYYIEEGHSTPVLGLKELLDKWLTWFLELEKERPTKLAMKSKIEYWVSSYC